ncbi:MAG: hypothetical protein QOJ27_725, partial [Sphingomonadales bacterium]|nr:hypothetical protein [Sphingomonadales bacterium]
AGQAPAIDLTRASPTESEQKPARASSKAARTCGFDTAAHCPRG